MKLSICPRYYEYQKWFAWYPVYWDYEGGKWIWLEFVYRKWDSFSGRWSILTKDQYYKRIPHRLLKDEWNTSAQNDKGNDCKKPPVMYSTKYGK